MLDFIKTVFASAIGFFLVIFLFFFLIFLLIVSTSSDPEPTVRSNSVLTLKASGNIPDRFPQNPFDQLFSTPGGSGFSLETLDNNLKKAAADERIAGILLEIDMLATPWSNLEHARRSLEQFREESGKFIYVTTNDIGFNEQGYYLATVADSIFAPPMTMMMMDGFVIEGTFLTGMLEKIGVSAEVVNRGAYKSAGDSFVRRSFSESDREQLELIYSRIIDEFETRVSERVGMTPDELKAMMDEPPVLSIDHYYELGFIDALISPTELNDRIKSRLGVNENRNLARISSRRYERVTERSAGFSRPARESIAVIYANGAIMPQVDDDFSGLFGETGISYQNFRRSLNAALNDSNVEAIVVRITSPGGAASTSDMIWQLIQDASEKKPIIASMGGVAASGGYYIAMAADEIFAEATTITGSIGVIGIAIDANELITDRLGIDIDEIRFNRNAGWLNPTQPLTDEHRLAYRTFIDSSYDEFVSRVAESRDAEFSAIDEVAQGRVWSGLDAYEAGLIDRVGGLDHAIARAAEIAELEDYSIRVFPREQTIFEIFSDTQNVSIRNIIARELPYATELDILERAFSGNYNGAWAIMPYNVSIK